MGKWLKVFAFAVLLLTCGCNTISFDGGDAKAMTQFFESKGLKGISIDQGDCQFYRRDGKLMAKVTLRFEFTDIYDFKGIKSK